jgi:hypothetical protein
MCGLFVDPNTYTLIWGSLSQLPLQTVRAGVQPSGSRERSQQLPAPNQLELASHARLHRCGQEGKPPSGNWRLGLCLARAGTPGTIGGLSAMLSAATRLPLASGVKFALMSAVEDFVGERALLKLPEGTGRSEGPAGFYSRFAFSSENALG